MRKETLIPAVLLAVIVCLSGCKKPMPSVRDMSFVDTAAWHDAGVYLSIPEKDDLRRTDFLLWVKSREGRLRHEAGPEFAARYIIEFVDSAKVRLD